MFQIIRQLILLPEWLIWLRTKAVTTIIMSAIKADSVKCNTKDLLTITTIIQADQVQIQVPPAEAIRLQQHQDHHLPHHPEVFPDQVVEDNEWLNRLIGFFNRIT